jgi:hypothetical protein
VKLDSSGNVLWSYNYQASGNINVMKLLPDVGFFLGGSRLDTHDALVYRMDSIGNLEMSKIYGDAFHTESLVDIVADSDNGYLMIADRDTNSLANPTGSIYIVKADSTGYSGCDEALINVIRTPYITTSWNLGLIVDTLVLTPDTISFNIISNGMMSTICESVGIEEKYMTPLEIYPNPTTGKFMMKLPSPESEIQILIYNAMGQMISAQIGTGKQEIQIDLTNDPAGIYFIRVCSSQIIFSGKILKN